MQDINLDNITVQVPSPELSNPELLKNLNPELNQEQLKLAVVQKMSENIADAFFIGVVFGLLLAFFLYKIFTSKRFKEWYSQQNKKQF